LLYASEAAKRGMTCFPAIHPIALVFLGEHFDVEFELSVQFFIESSSGYGAAEAGEDDAE